MKDFLGQEYNVGDKVLYAAMSGRSACMVLAEVVEIYEAPKSGYSDWEAHGFELTADKKQLKVKLQPLNSSRWKQHSEHTRYIDTRTGKGIDPFARSGKHMTGNYYEHNDTGQKLYEDDTEFPPEFPPFVTYYDWGAPDHTPEGWHFVKQEFQPYVKKIKEGPKPVIIEVTENIVKCTEPVTGDVVRLSGIKSHDVQPEYEESHPEWKVCQ